MESEESEGEEYNEEEDEAAERKSDKEEEKVSVKVNDAKSKSMAVIGKSKDAPQKPDKQ